MTQNDVQIHHNIILPTNCLAKTVEIAPGASKLNNLRNLIVSSFCVPSSETGCDHWKNLRNKQWRN